MAYTATTSHTCLPPGVILCEWALKCHVYSRQDMDRAEDNSIPFAELVRLIHLGDVEAMAELYDFISRGMRPYLSRQLEPQDFQDKLHDIFLEVLRAVRLGQLRDPERLMGFVRTVARRRVAVYIHAATRNRREHVEIGTVFWLASSRRNPEREVIVQQQKEMVNQTLLRMSQRERDVLSRFYLQEQRQLQICSEMGLTETQFRLLKWRSKARFVQLSRQSLAERPLPEIKSGPFNVTALA